MPSKSQKRIRHTSTGGVIDPLMRERKDIEVVASSCVTMNNFVPLIYGGVTSRAGFRFMADLGVYDNVRFESFNFGNSNELIFIFVENEILIADVNGLVTLDNPIVTPYLSSEIDEIQFGSSNNFIYLTHKDHPVALIKRFSNTNITYEALDYYWQPFSQEDGDITVTATADFNNIIWNTTFTTGYLGQEDYEVGDKLQLAYNQTNAGLLTLEVNINANLASSNQIWIEGGGTLTTKGTWDARVKLWFKASQNEDPILINVYNSNSDRNFTDVDSIPLNSDGIYYIQVESYSSNTNGKVYLDSNSSKRKVLAEITSISGDTAVLTPIIGEFENFTSTEVYVSSFSPTKGYPRTISFWDKRLVFHGSETEPNTIWMSALDSFNDFRQTDLESSAIITVLTPPEQSEVQWISQYKGLVVGTRNHEGRITKINSNDILSVNNITVKWDTYVGSSYRQPINLGNSLFFIENNDRKVQRYAYSFDYDGNLNEPISRFSDSLFASGVKDYTFQKQPENTIYFVMNDGTVVCLLVEQSQQILSFYTMNTNWGEVISASSMIRQSEEDIVFFAVRRNGRVYLEKMEEGELTRVKDGDNYNYRSCDSFITKEDELGFSVIDGLDHLEGQTVQILADGGSHPDLVVSGDQVELEDTYFNCTVGLPLEATWIPLTPDSSTTYGRIRRINNLGVGVFNSMSFSYEFGSERDLETQVSGNIIDVDFREAKDELGNSYPVKTTFEYYPFAKNKDGRNETVAIYKTKPTTLTVNSVVFLVSYGQDDI